MSDDRPAQDPRERLAELWAQRQKLPPGARGDRSDSANQQAAAAENGEAPLPPSPAEAAPAPQPPPAVPAVPSQADLERRLAVMAAQERRLARLEQRLSQQLASLEQPLSQRPQDVTAAVHRPSPPLSESPSPPQPASPPLREGTDSQRPILMQEASPSGPDDRRLRVLLWLALPLVVLVLALLVVVALARHGVGRTSGPALATAAPSSVTAGAAAAATSAPVATSTASAVLAAKSGVPTVAPLVVATATVTAATASATPVSGSAVGGGSTTTTAGAAAPLTIAATMTVGQSLCDLAVDDTGQRLYATDGGPNQLLVLDPATKQQVGRFDLGDSLCSIALDQQSQTVYAPTWRRTGPNTYDSSRVQVVNLTTGAIRTIADNQFPTGPFFDEQKRVLYVGNTATASLFTVDVATGTTHTVALPVKVNRVAVSSQNGDLYLASPEGDAVLVLDPTGGSVVATLRVGQRPWAVAADPKTGRILVSSELSGGVSLIDPATNQIIRTTPTGSHPRNLAVDGVHERFYVLNTGDRTVSVLDADGRLLSTSAPLPGAEDLSGIAVAGQTGQVFVVSKTHIYTLK